MSNPIVTIDLRWQDFLLAQHAVFDNNQQVSFAAGETCHGKRIYSLTHLGVLSATGPDASALLQGQLTCNVHEMDNHQAILGAMCNPKGRVITTFLLVKRDDGFLLILPQSLLEAVQKKLQMYVLRSKVTLTQCSNSLSLIGLSTMDAAAAKPFYADHTSDEIITIAMPCQHNRQLIIAKIDAAIDIWSDAVVQQSFVATNTAVWQYLDITAGLPWLDTSTSEEYIPQMLNIDKWGGISFNKGCYTGQEIVARTHYLGKAKRALFVAECAGNPVLSANAPVFGDDAENTQAIGNVLSVQNLQNMCKMLVVLNIPETNQPKLRLADHTSLTLLA